MKLMNKIMLVAAITGLIGSTAAQAEDVIKIGLGAPLTGGNAAIGYQYKMGATQAVEDINAAGGVNGKKLALVIGDDACDPKQAVTVANRFVDQDKVDAVVGHFCSSNTIPASDVYNDGNVLMVTPGSTNPQVTDRKVPVVIRMCGRDDQQGELDAKFMFNTLKVKRVAIINDKDTYGVGVANATRDAIKPLGVDVVLEDGLTRGEKDFNALVTKIKAAKVDAVFFGGLYAEAGLLVKQMRQQKLDIPFVAADGIADAAFITAAGGVDNTKGVYFSFFRDPRTDPSLKGLVEKLKAKGSDSAGYTFYSYASVQAIVAAMKANPGVKDGDKLADWLKNHEVETTLGKKTWDPKGDPKTNDYIMYVWDKDGQYVPYKG